jgi:hypothetical protein
VHHDDLDGLLDGRGQYTDEPGYGDGVPDVCWACNRHPAGEGPSGACADCRRRLRSDLPFLPREPRPLLGAHAKPTWPDRRRLRHRADEEPTRP